MCPKSNTILLYFNIITTIQSNITSCTVLNTNVIEKIMASQENKTNIYCKSDIGSISFCQFHSIPFSQFQIKFSNFNSI